MQTRKSKNPDQNDTLQNVLTIIELQKRKETHKIERRRKLMQLIITNAKTKYFGKPEPIRVK